LPLVCYRPGALSPVSTTNWQFSSVSLSASQTLRTTTILPFLKCLASLDCAPGKIRTHPTKHHQTPDFDPSPLSANKLQTLANVLTNRSAKNSLTGTTALSDTAFGLSKKAASCVHDIRAKPQTHSRCSPRNPETTTRNATLVACTY